jgi:hypothetical protein
VDAALQKQSLSYLGHEITVWAFHLPKISTQHRAGEGILVHGKSIYMASKIWPATVYKFVVKQT